jgi:CubicO group peptidase (beta-lactamase class C family)
MFNNQYPRSTPEAQGISSTAVLGFVEEIEKNIHELHSFMLLRHGKIVAEGWWSPYAPEHPHMLFSLSKSFTSTAIGLAVAEGRLSVDDPVISFFPEDLPEQVSQNLAAMRVRHLLSMSTGHHVDTTVSLREDENTDWVKSFLSQPVDHKPGTYFVYNSGATYMLSAIIQKVTGMKLIDYLQPRLFEPLGIENATWEVSPQGINTGGWGLSIKTEDIARFGQLYLQKGVWKDQRILPEAWVVEATSRQVSNGSRPDSDWEQGYAYQFWRCRHNIYRGDGAFGQYCIVMPDQDAVLAITSGVADMQSVLNIVWETLLPAMQSLALPANPTSVAKLTDRLSCLKLDPPAGMPSSPVAARVSGKTYALDANEMGIEAVAFDFTPNVCTFTAHTKNGAHPITCGMSRWLEGETTLSQPEPQLVAASCVWTAEDTLQMTLRLYETPFYHTFTCRFTGEQVTVDISTNVSFGPTNMPRLNGKLA